MATKDPDNKSADSTRFDPDAHQSDPPRKVIWGMIGVCFMVLFFIWLGN